MPAISGYMSFIYRESSGTAIGNGEAFYSHLAFS